jgi:hypothetical protein
MYIEYVLSREKNSVNVVRQRLLFLLVVNGPDSTSRCCSTTNRQSNIRTTAEQNGLAGAIKVSVCYIPLFRPAIFPVVLAPFCAVRSSVNNMSRVPGLQFTTSVYPKTTDVTPEGLQHRSLSFVLVFYIDKFQAQF